MITQEKSQSSLPADVVEKLCEYAVKNGRNWRSKLRNEWDVTNETWIRQVRNILGPSGLINFKP